MMIASSLYAAGNYALSYLPGFNDTSQRKEELCNALQTAVDDNDVDTIEDLLGNASDVALIAAGLKESEHSLLHVAVESGHVEALRAMLRALPAEFAQILNNDGLDLLMLAAQDGQVGVLRELLPPTDTSYGAQIATLVWPMVSSVKGVLGYETRNTGVNTLDPEENSLVSLAAGQGHSEAVALLIEAGANVHLKNRAGQDALMCAVQGGSLEVAQILVEAGADVHSRDRRERSVLHYAVFRQDPEMVDYLVAESGVNVNAEDWERRTPIFYVKDSKIAQILIDHGADINRQDEYRQTALMLAAWTGHQLVEQCLRDAGADPSLRNMRGRSADDMAKARNDGVMVRLAPMLVIGQHPDLYDAETSLVRPRTHRQSSPVESATNSRSGLGPELGQLFQKDAE